MKAVKKIDKKKLSLVLVLMLVTVFSLVSVYAFQNPAHKIEPNHEDIDPAIPTVITDDDSDPRLAAFRKAIFHAVRNSQTIPEELKYNIQIPLSWEYQVLTPEGFYGFFETQYTSEGWNVTIRNPVVPNPTYTVEIEYTGEVSFQWKGTVDQDGNVVETQP